MKKIWISIFCCLILISQSVFGITDEKRITLRESIDLALKENPQNKMAKVDTEIAKKEVKIAGQWQNPDVTFFQNLGRAGAGNPQQLGLAYEFELFKPFKRKKAAKLLISAIESNQKFYENDLRFRVKESYYNLLKSKSNLKITEEQKNLFKEILDNAIKEEASHKIPKTDVVLAKIEYNRSLMYYNEAKSDLISTRNNFNSVMNSAEFEFDTDKNGLDEDYASLLAISPQNKQINFEDIKKYVFTHRYDIVSAKKEVEAKKAELAIIKSKLIPDLEIFGGWAYQTAQTSESENFENGAYFGANLKNIPIINQYKPEIEKAKYEIEKAELKYQDLMIDVTRNINDAWEKYCVTRENLNFYNKDLHENSEELLDVSYKSLKKKEIKMTEFLLFRKMYIEMKQGYYNALTDYYLAYAQLLKEINISDINEIKHEKP